MNKKTFTTKKKAFSLIELAIVLIIIGLLIAGVTGGSALIKNAQLRSVMTEARGYQTAVNGFFERFEALPGDFSTPLGTMSPAGAFGNSDGQISHFGAAAAGVVANRLEGNIAWQHLINGGFVDSSFTAGNANAAASGTLTATYIMTPGGTAVAAIDGASGIPASRLSNAGWAFDYVTGYVSGYNVAAEATPQNVVILTGSVTSPGIANSIATQNIRPTAVLSPIDALSIDTKSDDGAPRTGVVRSAGNSTANLQVTAPGSASIVLSNGLGLSDCNSETDYTTVTGTVECALSFRVDPTN
ncbi:MAG: prepilin-type N-terminal cleavage/methylation domain-containing protein [Rickettsiales bacterium]|jgi:prepilin-type N-terminal cleavage/methylation domain-containing protein